MEIDFLLVVALSYVICGLVIYINKNNKIVPNSRSHRIKRKRKGKNFVLAKIIGYKPFYNGLDNSLSPILSYEIDGKEYRCVMYLLTMDDTEQNKLVNMNKEYILSYDYKNPNRVKKIKEGVIDIKSILPFIILTIFWIYIFIIQTL